MSIYLKRDKIIYTDFDIPESVPFCSREKNRDYFKFEKVKISSDDVKGFLREKLNEKGIEVRSLADFSQEYGLPKMIEIGRAVYLTEEGKILNCFSERMRHTTLSDLCLCLLGNREALSPSKYPSDRAFLERLVERYKNDLIFGFRGNADYEDHLGNKYKTLREMSEAYNISADTLKSRLIKQWGIEKALTEPVKERGVFYNGERYKSRKDLARKLGVNIGKLSWYLKKGKSLDNITENKILVDHLGNEFDSLSAMCRFHGLSREAVDARLKRGLTLEEALTYKKKKVVDFKGNEFKTIKEMCEFYGIPAPIFRKRILTWSLEDALTTPIKKEYQRRKKATKK